LTLLVDASVWVAAGAPTDTYHRAARRLTHEGTGSIAVLDLTLYEVANAVGVKYGQPIEAQNLGQAIITSCDADRIVRMDGDLLRTTIAVADKHGLTSYDAAYVATAQKYGWQLVSTDIRDLVSKGLAVTPDAADYP
jgi:predicted nucleic acid-binding protein